MPTEIASWSARAVPTSTDVWRRTVVLVAIGGVALALGLLIYLGDRQASHALLIPTLPALAGSQLFGVLGQWLPSFVHTFAFSLFTAAALAPGSTPRYGACVAWCAVNIAFELGQHPQISARLAEALHGSFGDAPAARALARYFVRGTFDVGDIAAAIVGALAAAALMRLIQAHPERHHAH